jgi:hypothetical protein
VTENGYYGLITEFSGAGGSASFGTGGMADMLARA